MWNKGILSMVPFYIMMKLSQIASSSKCSINVSFYRWLFLSLSFVRGGEGGLHLSLSHERLFKRSSLTVVHLGRRNPINFSQVSAARAVSCMPEVCSETRLRAAYMPSLQEGATISMSEAFPSSGLWRRPTLLGLLPLPALTLPRLPGS